MDLPVYHQLSKKRLDRLVCPDSWNSLAYYCDQRGKIVTAQEVLDPSYVPCVKVNFTIATGLFGFFVANLSNNKIYWLCDRKQRVHLPARKTKPLIRKLFGRVKFEIFDPDFLDSGYIFAPYIPLQVTPTLLDSSGFSLAKSVRTRYRTRFRKDFYGSIAIGSLC